MPYQIADPMRDYAPELLAEVVGHAETEGRSAFLAEAFTDIVLDELEELGLWPDYQLSFLKRRGLEVSAWGVDEVNEVLYVAITDFTAEDVPRTLGASERDAIVRRLTNFLQRSIAGGVDVAEHNAVTDLVDVLRENDGFHAIQCYLLTNRVSTATELPEQSLGDRPIHHRTWDLETLRRSRTTGMSPEAIDINIVETFGRGIPAIRSHAQFGGVDTLLFFLPGQHLADLYGRFGPRLLEQNVRSFLMARGKVNRGIRDTLRTEPERFLAYNNGITATASYVETNEGDGQNIEITRVRDLQIVNGAQTTASIAVAARDADVNITNVAVQVKLAVISPELVADLVPDISRYANAQNAVSTSDLSANDLYLRRLQEVSRSEWTPAEASARPTKWYFERARGSYAVEKTQAGTPAKQREFAAIYPRNQRFDKNELALHENTWARRPDDVCKGGQKNFIAFMETVQADKTINLDTPMDRYRKIFRDSIAKAILFRHADSLINRQLGGTYKRQVVAYTLAYLLEMASEAADLAKIWRTQALSPELESAIGQIAPHIKDLLIETGEGKNITEWAKRPDCWALLRDEPIEFDRPETDVKPSKTKPRTKSERAKDKGMTLALCIEAVFGEQIHGPWRRHRRRAWRHMGDTGISTATRQSTWHIFSADFENESGPYRFDVAVDFPMHEIVNIAQIEPMAARLEVANWIADHQR